VFVLRLHAKHSECVWHIHNTGSTCREPDSAARPKPCCPTSRHAPTRACHQIHNQSSNVQSINQSTQQGSNSSHHQLPRQGARHPPARRLHIISQRYSSNNTTRCSSPRADHFNSPASCSTAQPARCNPELVVRNKSGLSFSSISTTLRLPKYAAESPGPAPYCTLLPGCSPASFRYTTWRGNLPCHAHTSPQLFATCATTPDNTPSNGGHGARMPRPASQTTAGKKTAPASRVPYPAQPHPGSGFAGNTSSALLDWAAARSPAAAGCTPGAAAPLHERGSPPTHCTPGSEPTLIDGPAGRQRAAPPRPAGPAQAPGSQAPHSRALQAPQGRSTPQAPQHLTG
jgi:hypothetical protein